MKALSALCFIATGVALAAPAPDTPSLSEIAQDRDLSLYDRAVEFHASEPIDGSRQHGRITRLATLRKFIWEHWRAKRRGYASLTESGIDVEWTTHVFIEPTEKGIWHITLRVVSRNFLPPPEDGSSNPDIVSQLPEVAVVEHATRKKRDAPGNAQVLVFKAADGKEVWRL